MSETPFTPAEERRALRPPPPPDDPKYPEPHARYGGHAGVDELEVAAEAERIIGQWPASEQSDWQAALVEARRRLA